MNRLRKLGGWLRAVQAKFLVVVVLATLTASCMSVPIPQDNFIGQAAAEDRDVKAEFDARYPAGTPVAKLVDDMKALGAACAPSSSPDVVTCRVRGVLESYMFLPMLLPLHTDKGYSLVIDIQARNGLIESIKLDGGYTYGGRWLFHELIPTRQVQARSDSDNNGCMTSEVVLMNRRAVALAADSATTVQYFDRGERKQRYFKGTNKIFNLSTAHPIALMTYDSGNLRGVPWETIAKGYREHLNTAPRDFVAEYTADFFKYIENNRDLYTEAFLERQLLADIKENAGFILYMMDEQSEAFNEKDAANKKRLMEKGFAEIQKKVSEFKFIGTCSDADVTAVLDKHKNAIIESIRQDPYLMARAEVLNLDALGLLSVQALLKKLSTTMETTGLVLAGFGEKEFFPVLEQYTCYGFVLGKLICDIGEKKNINQENVTEILPFAQSEMSKAFMYGVQPSVLRHIHQTLAKAFDHFGDLLKQGNYIAKDVDIENLKEESKTKFGKEVAAELIDSHTTPMKRVVGLLPLDELAELAEILVRMESLKERVTRDTESVSGPIDVAVISKGDGFIWIKRKHYFDPKLNPRFFGRKGMIPNA
jgi:hypothetical protein